MPKIQQRGRSKDEAKQGHNHNRYSLTPGIFAVDESRLGRAIFSAANDRFVRLFSSLAHSPPASNEPLLEWIAVQEPLAGHYMTYVMFVVYG